MCATTFTHLVQNFSGTGAVRTFDGMPDHCPACCVAIEPRRVAAHSTSPGDLQVDFAFQCPRASCRRLFVAEYSLAADRTFALQAVCAPVHEEEYLRSPALAGRY